MIAGQPTKNSWLKVLDSKSLSLSVNGITKHIFHLVRDIGASLYGFHFWCIGGIEEQCVLQHSNRYILGKCKKSLQNSFNLCNRVCVVCLSPTHPLVKNSNVTVASIDFLVDGKRKKVS